MNIADFFLKIGITGGSKSASEVQKIDGALSKIKETSIEMKFAIAGAFLAIQRLTSNAFNTGSELTRFSRITGMTTKDIQQLTYAGEQFNATADETKSVIQGWQKSVSSFEWEGNALEGLNIMRNALEKNKGIKLDMTAFKNDFKYAAQYMQEFMTMSNISDRQKNAVADRLGFLNEGFTQAMKAGAFTADKINKAKFLDDAGIKALNKGKVSWDNLMKSIEMLVNKFVADIAPHLIDMIKALTPVIKTLSDAITGLVKYLNEEGYFQNIANTVKDDGGVNYAGPYTAARGRFWDVAGAVLGYGSLYGKGKRAGEFMMGGYASRDPNAFEKSADQLIDKAMMDKKLKKDKEDFINYRDRIKETINTNINNTFNVRSTDPKGVVEEVSKIQSRQLKSAYTQFSKQVTP